MLLVAGNTCRAGVLLLQQSEHVGVSCTSQLCGSTRGRNLGWVLRLVCVSWDGLTCPGCSSHLCPTIPGGKTFEGWSSNIHVVAPCCGICPDKIKDLIYRFINWFIDTSSGAALFVWFLLLLLTFEAELLNLWTFTHFSFIPSSLLELSDIISVSSLSSLLCFL